MLLENPIDSLYLSCRNSLPGGLLQHLKFTSLGLGKIFGSQTNSIICRRWPSVFVANSPPKCGGDMGWGRGSQGEHGHPKRGGWILSGRKSITWRLCVFCVAWLVLTVSSINPPFFPCLWHLSFLSSLVTIFFRTWCEFLFSSWFCWSNTAGDGAYRRILGSSPYSGFSQYSVAFSNFRLWSGHS